MAVIPRDGPRSSTTPSYGGSARSGLRAALAWAAVGIGILAITIHAVAPATVATGVFAAVGVGAAIAILVGVRGNRPAVTGPWYLLLSGQLLWVTGDLALILAPDAWPIHLLYVLGYLAVLAALAGFVHVRQPGRARDSLLDASIVVVGLGVVVWEFVVDPYQRQTGAGGLELVLLILFPLLALLLVGVAARLMGSHGRTPVVWLLGLGMVVLPIGEVLRVVTLVDVAFEVVFLSAWLASYSLVAAAALHPSMRTLTSRIPDSEHPLSSGRLVALVTMALLPATVAVIEVYRGLPVNLPLIIASTLVLSLLVIARISDERRRALQRALASMALVELLQRVATAANEAPDIEEAVQRTLGDICRTTGWAVGHVFVRSADEEGGLASSAIWHMEDRQRYATLRELTEAQTLSSRSTLPHRALQDGQPVWVRDVRDDPTHQRAALARAEGRTLGVRSHVAVPIGVDDGDASLVLEFFSPTVVEPSAEFLEVIAFVGAQLRQVVERSIAREAIEKARDTALESARLKSEFLAMMSHEIRTPMNAVIGMTGLLLDTELDATQRWYASSVRAAGEALLTIINDILDFSKIEAGKLTIETSDFSVDRLIEEVADLLGEVARPKGVDVYSYCHPDVPTAVHGDAGRIRQILVNLIGNAVKFTPKGEVTVRVRVAEPQEDGDGRITLRFEIIDTGIGLTEGSIANLFEPFVQADQSTTRRYGGTGLGLSISKRLVEIMGGQIGAHSTVGEGATFWFTLPLICQPDGDTEGRERPTVLERQRILILDDNPTNREIIERQVEAWGMRPRSVDKGADALRELRAAVAEGAPFAVAALDLNMPDMDGIEVAIRIKSDQRISDIALAMLTSTEGLDEAAQAEAAGVQVFLRKPVRQSQLYDAMMQLLLPATTAPADRSGPESRRRAGTILLVEDNPANQLVGQKMTERLGFEVDVVGDGVEALEALGRRTYDAILMDCQMPVMDGYEASRRIRASRAVYADVPIIALTAGAMAEDRDRCIAAGMSDYITKPVRPGDLEEILDRYVDHRDGSVMRRGPGEPPPPRPLGSLPVLDAERWQVLVDLTAERRGALHKIVDVFVSEAPGRTAGVQNLEDPDAARQAAHGLRGSAASLGLEALADLCRRIEESLVDGRPVDDELMEAVPIQMDKAVAALRKAMAEGGI